MEMYGNTICVSFTELVGGGIISKPTYDKYTREGRLTVVQRGGNGREALIAYRSMPNASVQHTMRHTKRTRGNETA